MLQAYSSNIDVAANAVCPLNSAVIDKGCAETLAGAGTIELNRCGVYLVECDGFCEPAAAGLVSYIKMASHSHRLFLVLLEQLLMLKHLVSKLWFNVLQTIQIVVVQVQLIYRL